MGEDLDKGTHPNQHREFTRRTLLRRGSLLGVTLAATTLPLAGCADSWTSNLRRSGTFEFALRHLRHQNPGTKARRVVVTMPDTVTATLVSRNHSREVIASWRAGRIDKQPPTPTSLAPGDELFALSDPMPRIADVRFEAQLADADPDLDSSETHYPELVSVELWDNRGVLQVRANLAEGRPPVDFEFVEGELRPR